MSEGVRSNGRARSRALTPVQHAWIRLQVALVPVYVWLFTDWIDLLRRLPIGLPGSDVQLVRDFIGFYVSGLIANQHDSARLYDPNVWAATIQSLFPNGGVQFPSIYGPQMAALFAPLARLPYPTALVVWVGLTVAIFIGCGYAIWRACPRLREWKWTVLLLLVADPGLHFTVSFGQITALGLLAFTAAFFALRANRPFLAGIAIGALVYKPQLGLVAAFVFVGAGEWRVVAGAIVGAALEIAGGCAFWGVSVLAPYVRSVIHLVPNYPPEFEAYQFHMHSWRTFFALLELPAAVAVTLYATVAVVIAVATLRCWRAGGPLPVRYAMLLLATVLINPHVYAYDLILLAPAFLLIGDWALGQHDRTTSDVLPAWPLSALAAAPFVRWFPWLLYAAYFAPLSGFIAALTHVQVSVLVLTALDATLVMALWTRSPRVASA